MPTESAIKSYSFFLFLLFLTTMGCWFAWGTMKTIMLTILGICLILSAIIGGIKFVFSRKNILLCAVFYIAFITVSLSFSIRIFFTQLPYYLIPTICVVCVGNNIKQYALSYITKWFAYLLISSFIVYVFSFWIGSSPLESISPNMETRGPYDNFLLYVRPVISHTDFRRFNGPFIESGHLGMMSAFLLFANRFDFKKIENIIIGFILLASFSLAGYILAFIGFFFVRYHQGKTKLLNLIMYVMLVGGFYFIGQYYNNGDNLINEKILSRLEYDEEKGITGNNRVSLYQMELYAQMYNDPTLLLMGYSQETQDALEDDLEHGNGYQLYFIRHGLIGTLVAFAFYILSLLFAKDQKYAFLFLIFVILCFLQRTYPFWLSWIICYDYAIRTRDKEIKESLLATKYKKLLK